MPAALLLCTALAIIVVDQITKVIVVAHLSHRTSPVDVIPGVLDLSLTRNSGAAFSLGEGSTWLLTIVSTVVLIAILRVSRRISTRGWAIALGGIAGGAAGNLCDRLLRDPSVGKGFVVDWIHLHHWPVFNVADSAITLSGIALVFIAGQGVPATVRRG